MNNTVKKINTSKMTQLAMLFAIEVVLGFSPLGFIQMPGIGVSITTMHIPVLVAAVLLGPVEGGFVGFAFGLVSMIKATTAPSFIDQLFSPFISGKPIQSLIMAYVPRILLGVLAGYLCLLFKKLDKTEIISTVFGVAIAKLTSSFLTLFCLWFFFNTFVLKKVFTAIISANALIEVLVAIILIPAICKPLIAMKRKKAFA